MDDRDEVATTITGGENKSLMDCGPTKEADPYEDIAAAPSNDLGGDEIPF